VPFDDAIVSPRTLTIHREGDLSFFGKLSSVAAAIRELIIIERSVIAAQQRTAPMRIDLC